jgi:hypothetical protein
MKKLLYKIDAMTPSHMVWAIYVYALCLATIFAFIHVVYN